MGLGDWMGIGKFTGGCFQGGLGVDHLRAFMGVCFGRLGVGMVRQVPMHSLPGAHLLGLF